ncbi:MAG: hypothetical protein R2809_15120 [Flavobacteriales bacterium]
MKTMDNPNQYRKQYVRREFNNLNELNALKQEVSDLAAQNKKLQEELKEREELMNNLFSFIESNNNK